MRVLLEMKQQIYWQEQDLNPSLWHFSRSCQKSGQGLDEQKSHKTMGIHNWTQNRQRALYQDPLPEE
jgi:hypothetical protein